MKLPAGLCVLLQDQSPLMGSNSLTEGHSSVISVSETWGEDCWITFAHAVIIPADGRGCAAVTGLFSERHGTHPDPLNMMDGSLWERELYEVSEKREEEAALLLSMRTLGCSRGVVCCFVITACRPVGRDSSQDEVSVCIRNGLYGPLSFGGQWAHFVFQSKLGNLDGRQSCIKQQFALSSELEKADMQLISVG